MMSPLRWQVLILNGCLRLPKLCKDADKGNFQSDNVQRNFSVVCFLVIRQLHNFVAVAFYMRFNDMRVFTSCLWYVIVYRKGRLGD